MPNNLFEVIQVRADESILDEALGTKDKFWIERGGKRWLFKESRPNTGEDWSEKLAAEIAHLIGVPAAIVELADCEGRRGTVSLSFVDREKGEELIHGNEILAGQVLGYDPNKIFGQADHTLDNIYQAIGKLFPDPEENEKILKQLASYMVIDGLVGNVDRHHENWGLVGYLETNEDGDNEFIVYVAPTYDHASCLGRELLDIRIDRILTSSDGVSGYISKGRGAIYLSPSSPRGENPLKLVEFGSRRFPQYFDDVLDAVKAVCLDDILQLVDKIPADRISSSALQFVKCFLTYTFERICNLKT